jgi:hypothetical protein
VSIDALHNASLATWWWTQQMHMGKVFSTDVRAGSRGWFMGRILLLLSLCLFSSCYPYPSYDSGYRQPYPPGYSAGYPAYSPGSYAPHYDPQDYAPHDQQHYQEYGGPGDATSEPAYGQPTYLSPPPVGHGEPAQGYDQPSYGPPPNGQFQPERDGGTQHEHAEPPDCDSPTNPMACN